LVIGGYRNSPDFLKGRTSRLQIMELEELIMIFLYGSEVQALSNLYDRILYIIIGNLLALCVAMISEKENYCF